MSDCDATFTGIAGGIELQMRATSVAVVMVSIVCAVVFFAT
jgi:hypothetical protein